jgi:hypothetical protein
MIYKCKKCGSESNDMKFGEWCDECVDLSREKIMPEKREYTHDLIFEKYLDDKCPICDGEVKSDSEYSHTENGGKCMAKFFQCSSCSSQYTVGYNRSRQPISSEVTINAVYPYHCT